MEVLAIVVFIVFSLSIAIAQVKIHSNRIKGKLNSKGGELISIERRTIGPFSEIRRGRSVYRVRYKMNNEAREGWVKFGDLSGPEWNL